MVVSTRSTRSNGIPKSTNKNAAIKMTVWAINEEVDPIHVVALIAIWSSFDMDV